MAAFAVPALFSFLFKVALLIYALRAPRRDPTTRLFMMLLGLLAIHNLVEILGFNFLAAHGINPASVAKFRYGYAYFAIAILCIAVTLHVSLRLSVDHWDALRPVVPLVYLPVPLLEYLLLGTDKLVAGFQPFDDFSVLRVPGSLYMLFEVYALMYALAALGYLTYGARGSRPFVMNRIRNRWWLLGVAPLILLHIFLIVANHFGMAKISSTVSIPIALTFFLAVATFATHQYRLFDVEFFFPWSKIRKRKTAFYHRIQDLIGAINELSSIPDLLQQLANTLRCQVALIGGPQPAVAFVTGQEKGVASELTFTNFPPELLRGVNHILVAQEVAESRPDLSAAMQRYHVGAIVPFKSLSAAGPHWMLLGNHFSDQVYTPLDFRMVETLFAALADRFLDNFQLVDSELVQAKRELDHYKRRLALAWQQGDALRAENSALHYESAQLRVENSKLRRERLHVVRNDVALRLPDEVVSGKMSMQKYLDEREADMVREALRAANGNKNKAARFLGIADLRTLHYMIERHRIDPNEFS